MNDPDIPDPNGHIWSDCGTYGWRMCMNCGCHFDGHLQRVMKLISYDLAETDLTCDELQVANILES